MTDTDIQLRVRLPEALKTELEARAKQNRRSFNSEVVACLEFAVAADAATEDQAVSSADLQRQIDELRERMDRIILKNELADPDTGLDMEVSAEGGSGSLLKNHTR